MRTKFLPGVVAAALMVCLGASAAQAAVGQAYYNHAINWMSTPALYFTVAGGPAHTCGDLWTIRNAGSWVEGSGWLCTDGSGNATKGPWSWSNQPSDETSYAYIEWPDGTRTNVVKHIWDKNPPTVSITSPAGSPPSSFYGTAIDNATSWGAGFDSSWAACTVNFRNNTTGLYWNQNVGSYNNSYQLHFFCNITSGMPSRSINWNAPNLPPAGAHGSSNCYTWEVRIYDGGQWVIKNTSFCV